MRDGERNNAVFFQCVVASMSQGHEANGMFIGRNLKEKIQAIH